MESVIHRVRDMEADKRRWIEAAVGHELQENQQILIHVLNVGVEPDEGLRRVALAQAADLARQGRANAAARGATESEVDAAIEEALRQTRLQSD